MDLIDRFKRWKKNCRLWDVCERVI